MNEAYSVVAETATIPPMTSPRLLDQVRYVLRAKHYSYRTEQGRDVVRTFTLKALGNDGWPSARNAYSVSEFNGGRDPG